MDPSTQITLSEFALFVGASERTIERLFLKEMGLSYSEWRYRFRLIKSLEYLAENQTITQVAYSVGYNHVSSYIAAFKKFFACTPKQYFNLAFSY
jgi:AraC-like DNA-binding protein